MLNDRMRTLLTEASKLAGRRPRCAPRPGRHKLVRPAVQFLRRRAHCGNSLATAVDETRTEKHQYMFKVYQRARPEDVAARDLTVHNISVALQKGGHPQHEQIFAAWQAKMERARAELARRKLDDPTWESDFMLKFVTTSSTNSATSSAR